MYQQETNDTTVSLPHSVYVSTGDKRYNSVSTTLSIFINRRQTIKRYPYHTQYMYQQETNDTTVSQPHSVYLSTGDKRYNGVSTTLSIFINRRQTIQRCRYHTQYMYQQETTRSRSTQMKQSIYTEFNIQRINQSSKTHSLALDHVKPFPTVITLACMSHKQIYAAVVKIQLSETWCVCINWWGTMK